MSAPIRRLVMLFLATVVATLLCGLALCVPSSVTADQAGFVARVDHSG